MANIVERTVQKTTWACPHCGAEYDTPGIAESCMLAGDFLKGHAPEEYVWQWVLLREGSAAGKYSFKAVIPASAATDYVPAGTSCLGRPLTLISSFGGQYYNARGTAQRTPCGVVVADILDFETGLDLYGLVPPVHWMRDMPRHVAEKIRPVLETAYNLRLMELSDTLPAMEDMRRRLVALEHESFSLPFGRDGNDSGVFPAIAEVPALKSQLIMEDDLYRLEETAIAGKLVEKYSFNAGAAPDCRRE